MFAQNLETGLLSSIMHRERLPITFTEWITAAQREKENYEMRQALMHPQKHQFKWASQKQLSKNGHRRHPNDESVPMDIDPLVFTQIRQATVSGGTTEAKTSRFRNEERCFYCGEQGHMARLCPKKKYQYSKLCHDGQKTFVNQQKHPNRPQYSRSKYDQPKSDHNQGF